MNRILVFILLILASISAGAQQLIATSNIPSKFFIKNEGQIANEHGTSNKDVLYLYRDGVFSLQLKNNGFSYEIFNIQKDEINYSEDGCLSMLESSDDKKIPNSKMTSSRIDVTLKNSNSNCVVESSDSISSYFNYYYSPVVTKSFRNVKAFNKITYKNIYNGIDLVFYAPSKNSATALRYEFIVHPGADFSKIIFDYEGTSQLFKNKNGSLVASTTLGYVEETKPYYFVEGNNEPIAAKFILKKNEKFFSSFQYNHHLFLTIDPNIIWGTYYGGVGGDEIAEVAVGTDLKPVISGHTISQYHIATTDGYQTNYGGGLYDLFVAKFNTVGDLEWGTYFGGDDKDYGYGVTVDHENNVIAVGNSQSQGLATAGAFKDSVSGPNADILIAKFSPAGALIWSTYYGGSGPENPRNVITDFKGDLYLSGTTASDTGIATPGVFQTELKGFDDSWIAKFSLNGNRLWGSYFGDTGVDRSHSITLDLSGNLYDGGVTSSKKGIATAGAQQTVYGGGTADDYIAKWDTTGHLIWASYCGGPEVEKCRGIEADSAGFIYLGGFGASDTLIATPDGFQPNWSEGYIGPEPTFDAFLVKYSTQGVRQWGTYYGGTKNEDMWGITLDKTNNAIYLVGSTTSLTKIAYYNPIQSSNGGFADGFIAKFKTDGDLEWGSYYGGKGSEQFEDVAIDTAQNIYACGRASSNSMEVTTGTYQQYYYGGYSDAVLFKFYSGFDCYDVYEPNESISNAKSLKSYLVTDSVVYGYNANIVNGNDADWYSVFVEPDFPNSKFILSAVTKNYDVNMYNELGVLIFQSSNTGLTPDTITVNSLASGTYYFEIPHLTTDFDSLDCYRMEVFKSDTAFNGGDIYDGVSDSKDILSFSVYPNPANETLSFEMPAAEENTEVIVYDLCGRIMIAKSFQKNTAQQLQHLSIKDLSSGPIPL